MPQHVVQKLLGHASPQMTARYAIIHDATVRAPFDEHQRCRVDIAGQQLGFGVVWKFGQVRQTFGCGQSGCGRRPQQPLGRLAWTRARLCLTPLGIGCGGVGVAVPAAAPPTSTTTRSNWLFVMKRGRARSTRRRGWA